MLSSLERRFISTAGATAERIDGRRTIDNRSVRLSFGHKPGLVHAHLGMTNVVISVEGEIRRPREDRPGEGTVVIEVEFSSLCGDNHASADAFEISGVLDTTFKESDAVDLETLCIVLGEKVWEIHVKVTVLEAAGNVLDCAGIGVMAALKHFRRPDVVVVDNSVVVSSLRMSKAIPLIIHRIPVLVSFGLLKAKSVGNDDRTVCILIDPSRKEEMVVDGVLTIAMSVSGEQQKNENDMGVEVCGIHKPGGTPLSIEHIQSCIDLALQQARRLTRIILEAVEEDLRKKREVLLLRRGESKLTEEEVQTSFEIDNSLIASDVMIDMPIDQKIDIYEHHVSVDQDENNKEIPASQQSLSARRGPFVVSYPDPEGVTPIKLDENEYETCQDAEAKSDYQAPTVIPTLPRTDQSLSAAVKKPKRKRKKKKRNRK